MTQLARIVFKARRTRHMLLTAAAGFGLALIVLGTLVAVGGLARLEARTIDGRFEGSERPAAPTDIVVVGIDQQTATYFNQWPLSRTLHADAIERLARGGAELVVLDVPFTNRSAIRSRASAQDALAKLPEWQRSQIPQDVPATEDDDLIAVLREHGPAVVVGSRRSALSGLVGPDHPDPLGESRAAVGTRALQADADGRVRRFDADGSAAAAAMRELGLKPATAVPDGALLNWYRGDQPYEYVSFGDVAAGIAVTRSFRGKVVFVGIADGVVHDNVRTPVGSIPSVVATATSFANLRDGVWIRELSWPAQVAIALGLALAVWVLLEFVALVAAVALSVGLVFGYVWLAGGAFERGVAMPVALPVVAAVLVFAGSVLMLAGLSVRERLRIKGLFARYVSPDVVAALVDSDDPIRLGGVEREITVLFSDIRGFTSLSERVDPATMVEQLNEYFAEMVEVVTEARGTLDKFLGDGLMAIFGAPVDQTDHAERACAAAVEMLRRLEQLNERRAQAGHAPLAIGIGLHTGRAVVGNVGSPLFRVDFTAIGDTVNLASRLEGLTKELDARILVSGDTAAAATDPRWQFERRGSVVVKGRTQSTEVFELTTVGAVAGANVVPVPS